MSNAAFTMSQKVTVTGSASLNLVVKHPSSGKPMCPYKALIYCSAEVTVAPSFTLNDGITNGGEWEWNASLTVAMGSSIFHPASSFVHTPIEGRMKSLTFIATGPIDVFVFVYYDGVEHDKAL